LDFSLVQEVRTVSLTRTKLASQAQAHLALPTTVEPVVQVQETFGDQVVPVAQQPFLR
jgi:hypothetical protein